MSMKAQIHRPTDVTVQKFPYGLENGPAFATVNLTDAEGNELITFLKDPIFARKVADRCIEAALFLEAQPEEAVA